jgi:hypothetical protein
MSLVLYAELPKTLLRCDVSIEGGVTALKDFVSPAYALLIVRFSVVFRLSQHVSHHEKY